MPALLRKLQFQGKVETVLAGADRGAGLEKAETPVLTLAFAGIAGDCHGGLTRASDSRTLQLYRRDTEIRNVRQATIVSQEELAEVAQSLGIPALKPEWIGANLVLSGIPGFTLLPPSTRLKFASGAVLVVDMENHPCSQIAEVVGRHHPDQQFKLVAAAMHKRGVTAWVEREGTVAPGDEVTVWLPAQPPYPHA